MSKATRPTPGSKTTLIPVLTGCSLLSFLRSGRQNRTAFVSNTTVIVARRNPATVARKSEHPAMAWNVGTVQLAPKCTTTRQNQELRFKCCALMLGKNKEKQS